MGKRIPKVERACLTCGGLVIANAYGHHTLTDRQYCSKECQLAIRRITPENRAERFWAKVHKGERCWIWAGAKHRYGYGACDHKYGDVRAHRAAWVLTNGPIPKDKVICHHCNTKLCVNPFHLYLGTQAENMADAQRDGLGCSRLTPEQVRDIRASDDDWNELAKKHGVDRNAVWALKTGRKWRHVV